MDWTELESLSGRIVALLRQTGDTVDWRKEAATWREIARLSASVAALCAGEHQQTTAWIVPGDVVADLSPNRRHSRERRWGHARMWRETTRLLWTAAGSPRFRPPVSVRITVRRGRRVDEDNAIAACKAVRDGLWGGPDAMLGADDRHWIEHYDVVQEPGARYRLLPEVEICVTGEPL